MAKPNLKDVVVAVAKAHTQAPVADTQAPVADTQAPVADTQAPVADTSGGMLAPSMNAPTVDRDAALQALLALSAADRLSMLRDLQAQADADNKRAADAIRAQIADIDSALTIARNFIAQQTTNRTALAGQLNALTGQTVKVATQRTGHAGGFRSGVQMIVDGTTYTSPTQAAQAIITKINGHASATNGNQWWGLSGAEINGQTITKTFKGITYTATIVK
jgi:hypothetical protein